jgi:hypothetical protein
MQNVIYKTSIFANISPGIKPVWSLLIGIGKTDLIRSAIQLEASLYTVFRRLIGFQFFINCLGLSPFGIQVIMPYVCVIDN